MAAGVVADPLIFGPRRSLDEAITQLRLLPGLDARTAQSIAMHELREPDAFPEDDADLLRAMRHRTGVTFSPTKLLAHAERWRPWRAYAALHLWASEPHAFPVTERVLHEQQTA
jgi:AraC family transcriptional regulator of adaptative response / DNA-3-methyladenine glycosylase II